MPNTKETQGKKKKKRERERHKFLTEFEIYWREIGKRQHKFYGKKLSNGISRDADKVNKAKG